MDDNLILGLGSRVIGWESVPDIRMTGEEGKERMMNSVWDMLNLRKLRDIQLQMSGKQLVGYVSLKLRKEVCRKLCGQKIAEGLSQSLMDSALGNVLMERTLEF